MWISACPRGRAGVHTHSSPRSQATTPRKWTRTDHGGADEARARGGTAPGRRRRSEGRGRRPRASPADQGPQAPIRPRPVRPPPNKKNAEPSASAREATRGQHFTSRSSEAYRSPTELSAHSGRQPGRQLALPKNGLWVEWSLLARRWSTISSLGDRWERGRERARNNRRGRREGGLR
ncbi:unnamed protein product [Prorocentrum cordatum]|uniref:Uncharacterized protein n=1 Tax=Prorocentrum cordatum TaxID=2364126 RepID=A0ABN9QD99_9DINO|nr:unnamed protein product [Polarella glacialis]